MRFLLAASLFAGILRSATLETMSLPSFFFYEENVGQADLSVRLLIRGGPHRVYFSDRSIHLYNSQLSDEAAVRFAAEDATPALRPIDAWPVVVNRFEGGEQTWRRNIPAYSKVEFTGIYPGVDLIVHESAGQPAFTYVIQPGADPASVVLDAGQAFSLLNERGDWLVEVSFGSWTFKKPRAYQQTVGTTTAVEVSLVYMPMSQVRLQAQSYDASRLKSFRRTL